MTKRQQIIDYCMSFPSAYEDYPFDDANWTVMRRGDTRRGFAWIFQREGKIWLNLKCDPEWGKVLQGLYPAVLPAYHMNKRHWISVILDGTVPKEEIGEMIAASYDLCAEKKKRS